MILGTVSVIERKVEFMNFQIMSDHIRIRILCWSSLVALLMTACGDNTNDKPNGPTVVSGETSEDSMSGENTEEGVALFAALNSAMGDALVLIVSGGGTIDGEGGGTLTVTGNKMTLVNFSPDGILYMDGELTLNLLASPMTITGDLVANGVAGQEGPVNVLIDATVDTSTDPLTYGGSLAVGEQEYDVGELAADFQE